MAWYDGVRDLFTKGIQGSDPNLGASVQFYSPGQPQWTPRNYKTFVTEGYKKNGTLYNCVNKISSSAAGINWKLYTDKSMIKEITDHELLDLWNKPNPTYGTGGFMEQVFGYWHLSGNSYIYAFRPNPRKAPVALWPLRPDQMKAVVGAQGIEAYVYGYGTQSVRDYDRNDILHLKFPAYDDDVYGLSPVEVASALIDQQNEGNGWNISLMQNAGKPASILSTKGYLTTEQRSQIRDELRKKYSGKKNAGLPLILEADISWQNVSLSPYELDWLQSRELNTREIAAIMDIAPELVGDGAAKTFSNVAEARQALYIENVLPKMDRFRDHLNMWILPMFDLKGAYFTYDRADIEALQPLYQAAKKGESDRATALWNSGQIPLDQAQEMQGIKPDTNAKGIYKIGAILVISADLKKYAEQSLTAPAAPPFPVAEGSPALGTPPPGAPPAPGKPKDGKESDRKALFDLFESYLEFKQFTESPTFTLSSQTAMVEDKNARKEEQDNRTSEKSDFNLYQQTYLRLRPVLAAQTYNQEISPQRKMDLPSQPPTSSHPGYATKNITPYVDERSANPLAEPLLAPKDAYRAFFERFDSTCP